MAEAIGPQADALTQAPAATYDEPATESAYTKEEITFTNGELQLAGTLVLPAHPGPHPALVMITASGPQDRDNSNVEMVPGCRPYREIAARLASVGIATLRYDDRGVGDSTGDVNVATSPELATDVEGALAYLRQRPEIDAEQIGLLGHSEGGLVAGIVAADNPQVAFVVLPADLNGPALTEALAAAGNEDMTVDTIGGVNHLFLEAEDADPANWGSRATDLEPEVLARIAKWLSGHVEVAVPSS